MGYFITFEGPEGSGKTSNMPPLVDYLRECHHLKVYSTREPGGTSISEQIRAVIHDIKNEEMHPRTETLLYQAARAQIVEQILKPHLADGEVVILDRYRDSTLAYQGYAHCQNIDDIRSLVRYASDDLTPDLTVLFNINVDRGLARKKQNGEEMNRMDLHVLAFHQRVLAGYRELAKLEPNRWLIVNADQKRDEVFGELVRGIEGRLMSAGIIERQIFGIER